MIIRRTIMDNKTVNIEIRTDILPSEKILFAKTVYGNCEANDCIQIPMAKDAFFKFALIKFFTNYDTESVVNDFDEIYMLVNNTDIIKEIKKNVKEEIIDDLQKNVDVLFGYSDNTILNSVQKILNNITKMTSEIGSDAFIEFINKFSDFSKEFEPEKIIDLFGNHKDLFLKDKK